MVAGGQQGLRHRWHRKFNWVPANQGTDGRPPDARQPTIITTAAVTATDGGNSTPASFHKPRPHACTQPGLFVGAVDAFADFSHQDLETKKGHKRQ